MPDFLESKKGGSFAGEQRSREVGGPWKREAPYSDSDPQGGRGKETGPKEVQCR